MEEVVAFVSQHVPNTELLNFIRDELKPRYKIGFLSNVGDNLMDTLFTKEQQALFDDVVLSFEVGIAKPQPEIYELSAKNLGLDTTECVFVDDVQRYIDGAEVAGMEAILFTSTEQFKHDIAKLIQ
ncbi:MAG TPA: HAD-IA family hydrolase [Candidatus Saccharibacteria bacterium]|nr:HAD-IA family hydrolase [Candidatus Saccharibacteria bacterium]